MIALIASLIAVFAAFASVATGAPAPLDGLLLSTGSPDSLRARLETYAATTPNPVEAARALTYRGLSFERGASLDSAIACYRRADARARVPEAHEALVQALLRRHSDADVQAVIAMLEREQQMEDTEGMEAARVDPSILGWAYVLGGQPKRGIAILKPLEARLTQSVEWRYRLARAYYTADQPGLALPFLLDLGLASRMQDREVARMLTAIEKRLGPNSHLRERLTEAQRRHDEGEANVLSRLHGRRVRVRASDGTLVGGAMFADSGATRLRSAVVIAALGDEPATYDSLTTALRQQGFAVFVLDPRGSGWSVQPEVSLPDTWDGRQEALESRVARDVPAALGALGRLAHADTTVCLGVGVGSMAPVIVAAAARDRHIRALALLDPITSPVTRGATLASFTAIQLPAYAQVGSRARFDQAFDDTLLHAGPPASRLETTTTQGFGAGQFGSPGLTEKFIRWLGGVMPGHGGRRSTPRASPRAG